MKRGLQYYIIRRKKEYNSIKKYYSLYAWTPFPADIEAPTEAGIELSTGIWSSRSILLPPVSPPPSVPVPVLVPVPAPSATIRRPLRVLIHSWSLVMSIRTRIKRLTISANSLTPKLLKRRRRRRRRNVINTGKLKSKNSSLSLSPPPHTQITWASVTWPSIGTRKGVGRYVQRYREWRGSFQ